MPPLPSLYTSKVELLLFAPDLILPEASTRSPPALLVIFIAPFGFDTSPAILIPLEPVFVIVILPLP